LPIHTLSNEKVSAVPSSFLQKVLIESFTFTNCGQCPLAHIFLDSLVRFNPGRVYGVSFHIDDVMADTNLVSYPGGRNYYDSTFNPSAIYPSGMLNRHVNSVNDLSPGQWSSETQVELSKSPSCGVALEAENLSGNNLFLTVHVGFSDDMFGEYRIHIYLVENSVTSNDSLYDQLNDFSNEGATPDSMLSLFALNDTIHAYKHQFVLRRIGTPAGVAGDPIPLSAMYKGNDYVKGYNVDITGINVEKTSVLVFVDKHGLNGTSHWIENVQVVPLGESKDWN
jgi:hypothetical protein